MISAFYKPYIVLIIYIWASKGKPVLSPVGYMIYEFKPYFYRKIWWNVFWGNFDTFDYNDGQYLGPIPIPFYPFSYSGNIYLYFVIT